MIQGILMLVLMAFWVPSAGASWAYCQRAGVVHPAGPECCSDQPNSADSCDCCHEEQPAGPQQQDCCIGGGKMLPEALLPITGSTVPGPSIVPDCDPAGMPELLAKPANRPLGPSRLRAPPPDRAVYLRQCSLRL